MKIEWRLPGLAWVKAEKKIVDFPLVYSERTREWWETATADDVENRVKAGADVNVRNEDGETPLHWAARWNRNPEVIALMVRHGTDVNVQDKVGDTPLHWAASSNPNPAVIDVLVRLGADANAQDEDGTTPLHWAANFNKNPAVIDALLDAGADASLKNNYGELPADYAAENEHIKDSKARWRLHEAR